MRIYATKVVIVFALFCTNSVIRAGTQSLAEGLQDVTSNPAGDTSIESNLAKWTSQPIDSGQKSAASKRSVVKRSPSGFMGMRGRRNPPIEEPYEDIYTAMLEKRAPSGFMGMRGKKNSILNELQLLEYVRALDEAGLLAQMSAEADIGAPDWSPDKRAPGIGFAGMRGKRNPAVDDSGATDDYQEDDSSDLAEAGPQAALTNIPDGPARGNQLFGSGFKRAPATGFMGMRGKKAPGGFGFFGMRGKKIPVDFRGKFVAVRGKKVPGGIAVRDWANRHAFVGGREYAMPEQQSGHQGQWLAAGGGGGGGGGDSEAESSKRAPLGFHGMRGKKWAEGGVGGTSDDALID